ncbi:hypothetical protein ACN38_g11976 [Penicillium nordicum]|uniref:Uncharacterized protein n=1 Tax=Penicillium nordicum TaxID=229535 RepID=A0A0M9WA91_9EURO|nr:hypothetical protein ACN38_g11976 [Penicillium nordicum]
MSIAAMGVFLYSRDTTKTHQVYSYRPQRANNTSEKEIKQDKQSIKRKSNISKMASSIIAANLQYISLMAFSSVFNLSRVNRVKFSWSLILFHAWTGVMYPFKSSLSAISKSL